MRNDREGSTGFASARLSRRTFIVRGGWAALSVGVLAACTPAAPTAPAAPGGATAAPATNTKPQPSGKLQLPTFVAPVRPAPDIQGSDIIPDAYINYPKNPTQSVAATPGDGSEINVAGEVFTALIPYENNTLWQQLNKLMNVNLKLNLAPFADWAFGKFQALVAGNELPDIAMVPIGGVIPELPAFLESKIQDLTPFVAGDAVKEYPNLAALPTIGWKGMVYNSKIFAVPIAQSQFYWGLWGHQEVLEANKLDWPKSAAEFRQTMKALTNAQQAKFGVGFEVGNRYAFGNTNVGGQLWPAIYGAPNNWGVNSSGKWTKDWETDQFKAGVQLARDVWADGSFDPDTTYNTITADTQFQAQRFAFRFSNALNMANFDAGAVPIHRVTTTQNPPWKVRLAPPIPAETGGKGQYNYGIGNFGLIILKKAPADRIKQLLKIINYIVAPFGSQEYLNVQYGVKDQDYVIDENGNPQRTPQGVANMIAWAGVLGNPATVLFDPQNKDFAPTMNAACKSLGAVGVQDPTVGLYSATNQKSGFLLQTKVADGLIDIITGRRPVSDYDALIKEWRSGGGDSIRSEFEQAYAQA
jgi:putative aldouronate transport system substrate-binding protein